MSSMAKKEYDLETSKLVKICLDERASYCFKDEEDKIDFCTIIPPQDNTKYCIYRGPVIRIDEDKKLELHECKYYHIWEIFYNDNNNK